LQFSKVHNSTPDYLVPVYNVVSLIHNVRVQGLRNEDPLKRNTNTLKIIYL